MKPPSFFLAFASDLGKCFLPSLAEEICAIQRLLEQPNSLCRSIVRPNAGLEEIVEVFIMSKRKCLLVHKLIVIIWLSIALTIPTHAQDALHYRDHGNASQAIQLLQQQLAQTTDTKQRINLHLQLSTVYLRNQQLDHAAASLQQAQQHLQHNTEHSQYLLFKASWALHAGNLAIRQQQVIQAQRHYQQAAKLAEQQSDIHLAVKAWLNLTQITPQEQIFYQNAVNLTKQLPDSVAKAWHWLKLGNLASNPTQQLHHYQAALKLAQQFNDARLQAFTYGSLGAVYLEAQRYPEAQKLTQQAIFFAQQAQTRDSLYRWYWQQARIARQQQQLSAAIQHYQQAVTQVAKIRSALRAANTGISEDPAVLIETLYFEWADVLLQHASQVSDAEIKQQRLQQAQHSIEQLKHLELQNYYQDDCVTALNAQQRDVQQILPANTAVLYPIVLPQRTELLLSLPTQKLQQITVSGAATDLQQQIQRFLLHLQPRPAQRLYAWLIEPLQATLQQYSIETLVIVPHGALRPLPFSALYDGQQYLIEQYALAITPSLSLTDPQQLSRQTLKVLLGGVSEAVQTFPALPKVSTELQQIHALYGGDKPLKNKNFIASNLQQALRLKPYQIVHFASHGQFHSNPQDSFILTYDAKLTLQALADLVRLGQFRTEPLELLTLSACQTARGDTQREAEQAALGLAGVALQAGARSALASLWAVDDAATAVLIPEFYRQLQQPNRSKAQALQAAQQLLLTIPSYQHPKFWASFILIGNWL